MTQAAFLEQIQQAESAAQEAVNAAMGKVPDIVRAARVKLEAELDEAVKTARDTAQEKVNAKQDEAKKMYAESKNTGKQSIESLKRTAEKALPEAVSQAKAYLLSRLG